MKTSDIIKNIRNILALSQTDLAKKLGVSFATVNRWEKGHCPSQPRKMRFWTAIYERFKNIAEGCDMIIGYIADDRMFTVLDRFFRGDITDVALINSLSALKLGKQYVAITQKACSQVEIVKEESLSLEDRETLKMESEKTRKKGIALAWSKDMIQKSSQKHL